MNGRHLPAGQGIQYDTSRRRPYNQQHYQPASPIYNGYMNPYANYQPQPHYHNQIPSPYAGIPSSPYPPYQAYGRSPPPHFQQYAAPPVVSSYQRPQQSPAVVSSPYQPPPPQTPSSTHSASTIPVSATLSTPRIPKTDVSQSVPPALVPPRSPFRAPVNVAPSGALSLLTQTRRKRKVLRITEEAVELPSIQSVHGVQNAAAPEESPATAPLRSETPSTSQPPSEEAPSTTPTTPISSQQTSAPQSNSATQLPAKGSRHAAAVPIVPIIPKQASHPSSAIAAAAEKTDPDEPSEEALQENLLSNAKDDAKTDIVESKNATATASGPPRSWANLFKGSASAVASTSDANTSDTSQPNTNGSFSKINNESLAEALHTFSASTRDAKLAFIEPRGLINTGNMCYMNSVLVFCVPFYGILDQAGKRAAHSFKSDTPLIDAMIMFMREFRIIDSATSVEQLRMRLKEPELEQYGEAFTPEFVYDVIRKLPRFSTMRRGHQQDAEEFLGFLLEGLHDECVQVMRSTISSEASTYVATPNPPSSPVSEVTSLAGSVNGEGMNGWLEVGPKQKAAVTRSSGTIAIESPITKIFGGTLRSELRVPGLKTSVTLEPYQPLQLDIGSPQINNITDALKGLTRSETLHGDFKSPRGPNVAATKQVLIETLPPVLILHLKRFQYDNTGGTQKIWKKIGYPLELEIPKEVFSRQKQGSILNHGGLPKYRLIAVVYHHGKNASGGHYTVDVRRQDGREWIRLDDTVIRRVRSKDVAEAGSEEDLKTPMTARDGRKKDTFPSGNIFDQIKDDEDDEGEDGWKQVNGLSSSAGASGKKLSSVADGTGSTKTKNDTFSVKDNKVAYLLFYQKTTA
ncbi:MAG: hypothetical protein M1818_002717 [Claussenomyces sp. TS43310]|nr:MAG: hypothetical protein M1818_002717 [Claussenomyces sp. TS43310]